MWISALDSPLHFPTSSWVESEPITWHVDVIRDWFKVSCVSVWNVWITSVDCYKCVKHTETCSWWRTIELAAASCRVVLVLFWSIVTGSSCYKCTQRAHSITDCVINFSSSVTSYSSQTSTKITPSEATIRIFPPSSSGLNYFVNLQENWGDKLADVTPKTQHDSALWGL